MSLHNSRTGNKPVIMGQSQAGYRGRVLPNLLGTPSSLANLGKRCQKESALGSHLWGMHPTGEGAGDGGESKGGL